MNTEHNANHGATADGSPKSKCPFSGAGAAKPTTDVDLLTREMILDPFPWLATVRKEQPVVYLEKHDLWLVSRHEDVMSVYKDMETFSSANAHQAQYDIPPSIVAEAGPDWRLPVDHLLNSTDPPEHMPLKRILVQKFHSILEGMDEWAIPLANRHIDKMAPNGKADLVAEFTWPFVIDVFARLLGIPAEQTGRFRAFAEGWFELTGSSSLPEDRIEAAFRNFLFFERFLTRVVAERRQNPQPDFPTLLISSQAAGAKLSDRQILTNLIGFVVAGTDTTANSIAQVIYALMTNRQVLARIMSDPSLIPTVIEEAMRLRCPVRGMVRVTTRETTLGGVTIPKGANVYVHIASGSRDGDKFDHPDQLDPDRANVTRHLAFGAFGRVCLGAPLARKELSIAVSLLTQRLPNLRLAATQGELQYTQSIIIPSLRDLRIEFDPVADAAPKARSPQAA
jgi:cytochrome P450